MKLVCSNWKWQGFERKGLAPYHARVPPFPLQIHGQKDECRDWGSGRPYQVLSCLYAVIFTFLVNKWTFFFFGYILIAKIVCRLNRVQENAMIYRRTSGLLWRNDDDDYHIKDYRRKTTSSSSFPPLLLILSHDDLFLFYWCWTSTIQSCWVAMKIPWAIAPKAVKKW